MGRPSTETRYRVAQRAKSNHLEHQPGITYTGVWTEVFFEDKGDLSKSVALARMRLLSEEQAAPRPVDSIAQHPRMEYRLEQRTITTTDWEEVR